MKLPFVFGVHNHQPVGNFDHVIEKLTRQCYQPFLELVQQEKTFCFSFHVSGFLLKWWEKNSPKIIELLGKMVESKQLELVTGGFFEPILTAIPREDRKEQVLRHKDYLKKLFGVTPVGLWLTERVWEQHLVEDLVELGIKYVVVDDRHFLVSGFDKKDLYGYYLTESDGRRLAVFPIDEILRYAIPFWEVGRIEQYLNEIISFGGKMAIYFDDGEKFGAWPGTKKWVYDEGWLKEFLKAFSKWVENELIEPLTYEKALERIKPLGLAYLPVASYMEMEEWALPASRILELEELKHRLDLDYGRFKAFIRGGHWKNFLVKYSESNYLHKRVLQVSNLSKIKKPFDQEARLNVLAAQCNDAYWHGIFGGLYLPHLRHAAWQALLSAESRLRIKEKGKIEIFDLDYDGREEIIYHSSKAILTFKPSYGAHLIEWSDLSIKHNFQNTLTRRFEAYHKEIKNPKSSNTKEKETTKTFSIHHLKKTASPEILEALVYDWYERHSLIEHFFDPSKSLSDFVACDFGEWGDFANQPFQYHRLKDSIVFFRDGGLYPYGQARRPMLLRKIIKILKSGLKLEITYEIEYRAEIETDCNFGIEFNIFSSFMTHGNGGVLVDGKTLDIFNPIEITGSILETTDKVFNKKWRLILEKNVCFYVFPVNTVSQSEKDYDLTFQGLAIMPFWRIKLQKENPIIISLLLEIS